MKKIRSILMYISLLFLSFCPKSEEQETSYIYDVEPIFISSCVQCHTAGHYSQLDLSSFDATMEGKSLNGPIVTPFYPDLSLLFEKIAADQPSIGSAMPLVGPPLSGTEIQVIERWIFDGAKDN